MQKVFFFNQFQQVTLYIQCNSSCFVVVAKACAENYGDEYIVVKEECVGHVQKRMGSGMRN